MPGRPALNPTGRDISTVLHVGADPARRLHHATIFEAELMMLTHKGWFGLCPVYIGELETGCPLLIERHWSLLPLMLISEWLFAAIMFVRSWQDPEWEPAWPIKVTGDIDPRPEPGA